MRFFLCSVIESVRHYESPAHCCVIQMPAHLRHALSLALLDRRHTHALTHARAHDSRMHANTSPLLIQRSAADKPESGKVCACVCVCLCVETRQQTTILTLPPWPSHTFGRVRACVPARCADLHPLSVSASAQTSSQCVSHPSVTPSQRTFFSHGVYLFCMGCDRYMLLFVGHVSLLFMLKHRMAMSNTSTAKISYHSRDTGWDIKMRKTKQYAWAPSY